MAKHDKDLRVPKAGEERLDDLLQSELDAALGDTRGTGVGHDHGQRGQRGGGARHGSAVRAPGSRAR